MANKTRKCYHAPMDEGRKRVIGMMAAILASLHMQTGRRFVRNAAGEPTHRQWAERIMEKIDRSLSDAAGRV
jgi:hypothetical protein